MSDDAGAPAGDALRLAWGEPACGDAGDRLAFRAYAPDGSDAAAKHGLRRAFKRSGFARCDGCGYWIAAKRAEADADPYGDLMRRLGVLGLAVEHRGLGAPVTRH